MYVCMQYYTTVYTNTPRARCVGRAARAYTCTSYNIKSDLVLVHQYMYVSIYAATCRSSYEGHGSAMHFHPFRTTCKYCVQLKWKRTLLLHHAFTDINLVPVEEGRRILGAPVGPKEWVAQWLIENGGGTHVRR